MLATVEINHVQHISFTQSRLTDAVSVILSELLSYEHPPNRAGIIFSKFDTPLKKSAGSVVSALALRLLLLPRRFSCLCLFTRCSFDRLLESYGITVPERGAVIPLSFSLPNTGKSELNQ